MVPPIDLQSKCLNLHLKLTANLVVLEIPDPVKDILLGLLLQDILMQNFVLSLKLLHALWVAQVCLLELVVLLLELVDKRSVHLIQASDARLISLNQLVLGTFKQIAEVSEVLVLDLGSNLEDEAKESHETSCRNVSFFYLLHRLK